MKKILMMAGIIIPVVLLSTCTLFETPENATVAARPVELDSLGREIVTVAINTGGGGARNVSFEMTQMVFNYVEVVFRDPAVSVGGPGGTPAGTAPSYIRVAGPRGKVLLARLPSGLVMTGAVNAIAFGGYMDMRTDERTLLATGIITKMGYTDAADNLAGPFIINTGGTTDSVTFTLVAIETQFNPNVSAASSFKVTQDGVGTTTVANGIPPTAVQDDGYGEWFYNRSIDFEGRVKKYPVYKLPSTTAGMTVGTVPAGTGPLARQYTAEFVYGIGGDHGPGIWADLPTTTDYGTGNMIAGFQVQAVLTDNDDDGIVGAKALFVGLGPFAAGIPADGTGVGGSVLTTVMGTAPYGTLTFPLRIIVQNIPQPNGWVVIDPSLTVYPLDKRATIADNMSTAHVGPPAGAWKLSNGIRFYNIHDNEAVTTQNTVGASTGGGVLLRIGDEASSTAGRAIKIIVVGPYPR